MCSLPHPCGETLQLTSSCCAAHWDQVNPSPGVFDFSGFRDLGAFLKVAQQVGLWVIVRPGRSSGPLGVAPPPPLLTPSSPAAYINAETTGGGTPGWVTTIKGNLRSNASDYEDAWKPYIQAICAITKPFQITEGGPVILMQVENELSQTDLTAPFFSAIEKVMLDAGIVSGTAPSIRTSHSKQMRRSCLSPSDRKSVV